MIEKKFDPQKIVKYLLLILTIISFIFALKYTFTTLDQPKNINIILMLPFIIFLTPYLFISLYNLKRVESKMQVIPRFLRDIVDNVESGMDLITSIKHTGNNEYSVLNEDIEKLSNQLSWGVDFEVALMSFANNIGSANLKRDFLLVIEARKVGGHVEKILRELSQKINVDNLRSKERKSNLASNTFTGYISFVIFIFIIILVYNNLFVGIAENMEASNLNGNMNTAGTTSTTQYGGEDGTSTASKQSKIYLSLLILLSYELAILSGFLFGLMQENNIISGGPHVVILVTLTFIGFFFFI
jgi:pilus assembly protein TadC